VTFVIRKRHAAKRDLLRHYVYLAEEAGIDVAERSLSNAGKTFRNLARHPQIGAPVVLSVPQAARLRRWPVSGSRISSFSTFRAGAGCPSYAFCTVQGIGGLSWDWLIQRLPESHRRKGEHTDSEHRERGHLRPEDICATPLRNSPRTISMKYRSGFK
jgi:plasmid stabilization system protein ParE